MARAQLPGPSFPCQAGCRHSGQFRDQWSVVRDSAESTAWLDARCPAQLLSLCRVRLDGCAPARELEVQHPHTSTSALRRGELPFSRGIAGEPSVISAGTGILEDLTDDLAGRVNEQ